MPAQSKVYIPGWGHWPIQEHVDRSELATPQPQLVNTAPEVSHPAVNHDPVNQAQSPQTQSSQTQTSTRIEEEEEASNADIGTEIEQTMAEPPLVKRRWNRASRAANLGGS